MRCGLAHHPPSVEGVPAGSDSLILSLLRTGQHCTPTPPVALRASAAQGETFWGFCSYWEALSKHLALFSHFQKFLLWKKMVITGVLGNHCIVQKCLLLQEHQA